MSRKTYQFANGTIITPAYFYGQIAKRDNVKPRLLKKAQKIVDAANATSRLGDDLKKRIRAGQYSFEDFLRDRRQRTYNRYFRKLAHASNGLRHAYASKLEYYQHFAP